MAGWEAFAHQQFDLWFGLGVHDGVLISVPPIPGKYPHISLGPTMNGLMLLALPSFDITQPNEPGGSYSDADANGVVDEGELTPALDDESFKPTFGPSGIPFMGRTTDAGFIVPHISIPINNGTLPITILFGSSIQMMGSSSIRLKTHGLIFGDDTSDMACGLFPDCIFTLNLGCNDLGFGGKASFIAIPLPTDFTFILQSSVKVGVTLGDLLNALITFATECVAQILGNGLGEGLGKLGKGGSDWVKGLRKSGAVGEAGEAGSRAALREGGGEAVEEAVGEGAERGAREAAEEGAGRGAREGAGEAAEEGAGEAGQQASKVEVAQGKLDDATKGVDEATGPLKQANQGVDDATENLRRADQGVSEAQGEVDGLKQRQAELEGLQQQPKPLTQADQTRLDALQQENPAGKLRQAEADLADAEQLRTVRKGELEGAEDAQKAAQSRLDEAKDARKAAKQEFVDEYYKRWRYKSGRPLPPAIETRWEWVSLLLGKGLYASKNKIWEGMLDLVTEPPYEAEHPSVVLSSRQVQDVERGYSIDWEKDGYKHTTRVTLRRTDQSPITVRATFSKPVEPLTVDHIQAQGCQVGPPRPVGSDQAQAGLPEAYTEFDFSVTPTVDAGGTFRLDIDACRVEHHRWLDPEARTGRLEYPNKAAEQYSVCFDCERPTVTLTSSESGATNAATIPVTATFSQRVRGFAASDLQPENASVEDFAALDESNHYASSFRFDLRPASDGEVAVTVPRDVVMNIDGVGNLASARFSIDHDSEGPVVTLSRRGGPTTGRSRVPVNVELSEEVPGFGSGNLRLTNASVGAERQTSPTSYTVVLEPLEDGTVEVFVDTGAAVDAAGNPNAEPASLSFEYRSRSRETLATDYPELEEEDVARIDAGLAMMEGGA